MLMTTEEIRIMASLLEKRKKERGILIAENNLLMKCQDYIRRLAPKREIPTRSPTQAEQIDHEKDHEEDRDGRYR